MATRRYVVPPGGCTLPSPGHVIQCTTVAGVGANYTFVVEVEGGGSAPSVDRLLYSPPIINSVDGPGAVNGPAAGGAVVYLHGVCVGVHSPQAQHFSSPALCWVLGGGSSCA
jgi:hypothetical protein